ncbi:hypothetical protein NQT62_10010 [Limnobacter humi]|uniref:Bile acid:sodium symporter n=1 Tax=Limnobacter humi TaxID=1778671 RepID=A0ABT1WH08_9BURK|nr:hypothetical protein [Limnobacter humi]MCQ8896765.1 hypothetical protein [Limnobacter humi]
MSPLLLLMLLHTVGVLSQPALLGLSVCILAGTGTSSVPMALAVGANPMGVSSRLMVSAVVALLFIPFTTFWLMESPEALHQAALVLAVLLFAVGLPWVLGQWFARQNRPSAAWRARLDAAGNWSVLALIVLVAVRELPKLSQHWDLAAVSLLLVFVLCVGGIWAEGKKGLAITALIRNLTLSILVLNSLNTDSEAFTAMSVFGALMYLAAIPLNRWSRRKMQSVAEVIA